MSENPTLSNEKNDAVNLAALTPLQMAEILAKASGRGVGVSQIQKDIEDGAPVDSDGNLNLLAYAAWLAKAAQALGH